jgi:hypothetical protein
MRNYCNHKLCINQYNKKYSQAYHLLKLLFKLLLADMRVIDGVGFDEREVMLLNSPFSFGFWSILVFSLGGFSMYFGKGAMNP